MGEECVPNTVHVLSNSENISVRAGWRCIWSNPSEEKICPNEVIGGPFSSPLIVSTTPFVVLKKSERPPKQTLSQKEGCTDLNTGIPDPWNCYLTLKAIPQVSKCISPCEIAMYDDNLQITETIWDKWGIPLNQGIPDPWKNWPRQSFLTAERQNDPHTVIYRKNINMAIKEEFSNEEKKYHQYCRKPLNGSPVQLVCAPECSDIGNKIGMTEVQQPDVNHVRSLHLNRVPQNCKSVSLQRRNPKQDTQFPHAYQKQSPQAFNSGYVQPKDFITGNVYHSNSMPQNPMRAFYYKNGVNLETYEQLRGAVFNKLAKLQNSGKNSVADPTIQLTLTRNFDANQRYSDENRLYRGPQLINTEKNTESNNEMGEIRETCTCKSRIMTMNSTYLRGKYKLGQCDKYTKNKCMCKVHSSKVIGKSVKQCNHCKTNAKHKRGRKYCFDKTDKNHPKTLQGVRQKVKVKTCSENFIRKGTFCPCSRLCNETQHCRVEKQPKNIKNKCQCKDKHYRQTNKADSCVQWNKLQNFRDHNTSLNDSVSIPCCCCNLQKKVNQKYKTDGNVFTSSVVNICQCHQKCPPRISKEIKPEQFLTNINSEGVIQRNFPVVAGERRQNKAHKDGMFATVPNDNFESCCHLRKCAENNCKVWGRAKQAHAGKEMRICNRMEEDTSSSDNECSCDSDESTSYICPCCEGPESHQLRDDKTCPEMAFEFPCGCKVIMWKRPKKPEETNERDKIMKELCNVSVKEFIKMRKKYCEKEKAKWGLQKRRLPFPFFLCCRRPTIEWPQGRYVSHDKRIAFRPRCHCAHWSQRPTIEWPQGRYVDQVPKGVHENENYGHPSCACGYTQPCTCSTCYNGNFTSSKGINRPKESDQSLSEEEYKSNYKEFPFFVNVCCCSCGGNRQLESSNSCDSSCENCPSQNKTLKHKKQTTESGSINGKLDNSSDKFCQSANNVFAEYVNVKTDPKYYKRKENYSVYHTNAGLQTFTGSEESIKLIEKQSIVLRKLNDDKTYMGKSIRNGLDSTIPAKNSTDKLKIPNQPADRYHLKTGRELRYLVNKKKDADAHHKYKQVLISLHSGYKDSSESGNKEEKQGKGAQMQKAPFPITVKEHAIKTMVPVNSIEIKKYTKVKNKTSQDYFSLLKNIIEEAMDNHSLQDEYSEGNSKNENDSHIEHHEYGTSQDSLNCSNYNLQFVKSRQKAKPLSPKHKKYTKLADGSDKNCQNFTKSPKKQRKQVHAVHFKNCNSQSYHKMPTKSQLSQKLQVAVESSQTTISEDSSYQTKVLSAQKAILTHDGNGKTSQNINQFSKKNIHKSLRDNYAQTDKTKNEETQTDVLQNKIIDREEFTYKDIVKPGTSRDWTPQTTMMYPPGQSVPQYKQSESILRQKYEKLQFLESKHAMLSQHLQDTINKLCMPEQRELETKDLAPNQREEYTTFFCNISGDTPNKLEENSIDKAKLESGAMLDNISRVKEASDILPLERNTAAGTHIKNLACDNAISKSLFTLKSHKWGTCKPVVEKDAYYKEVFKNPMCGNDKNPISNVRRNRYQESKLRHSKKRKKYTRSFYSNSDLPKDPMTKALEYIQQLQLESSECS